MTKHCKNTVDEEVTHGFHPPGRYTFEQEELSRSSASHLRGRVIRWASVDQWTADLDFALRATLSCVTWTSHSGGLSLLIYKLGITVHVLYLSGKSFCLLGSNEMMQTGAFKSIWASESPADLFRTTDAQVTSQTCSASVLRVHVLWGPHLKGSASL